MTKEEVIEKLNIFNDSNFKFDPIKHKYTYEDNQFISVTQFISRFHNKFDIEHWSKVKADEFGISQDEMKAEWQMLNDRANVIGTGTHNWIEFYYNRQFTDLPTDPDIIDRINKFNKIYSTHLYKLTPVKFEQRIFSKKYKIAGMIDSIFIYGDNILILDWKTNKDYTTDDHPKGKYEKLLYPFDFLWKNHLNEYSIQISMYMMILKEYGINVKQGYLVHIGPNTEAQIFKTINLVDLIEEFLEKNPI